MNLSVMLDGGQVYVCLTYRTFYCTVRCIYIGHLNTKMLLFYAGGHLKKCPLKPKYCTSFSNKISGSVFLLFVFIIGLWVEFHLT